MTVQATFAATLVDEWRRCGVTDAVVAPGSRSTPLTLALAAAADAGALRLHVHVDERAAGFFALGIGLASGRPAVVVTTSGTAAVELHPAVVEAHHAGVPLLVCTADRPPELRDVGAPQTIDQQRLYGAATRWFADPGVPDGATAGTWRSLAARAVAEAADGPVHLNLAFRDPLTGEPGELPPARRHGQPWHSVRYASGNLDGGELAFLAGARRGVIVAGRGAGDPVAVEALAAATRWPVLADPLSGCRRPSGGAPGDGGDAGVVVGAFDALLRVPSFAEAHRPDAVVHLGAPPASKALGAWLAELEAPLVAVPPGGAWIDPHRRADVLLGADPDAACWALAEVARPAPPEWHAGWAAAEEAAQDAFDAVLSGHAEPTEPGVARSVAAAVPPGTVLVVSSSMPVRDLEWYARPRDGLRVLANRGANGIDGVVSTALGVAAAGPTPAAALLGDLAFLHDAGGLLGASGRGVDCTFVVVDNDGGGIFSFLPQAAVVPGDRFERLFGTPHGVDLGALAAVHGIAVTRPGAAVDVGPAVEAAVDAGGVRLVLVRTDRGANVAVHDELHAAVAAALGG